MKKETVKRKLAQTRAAVAQRVAGSGYDVTPRTAWVDRPLVEQPAKVEMGYVPVANLRTVAMDVLTNTYGHSAEHASVMADVMEDAQMRGGGAESQGYVKLTGAGMPKSERQTEVTVAYHEEGSSVARIDGGQNPGMVVMNAATEMAIQMAKESGVGVVTTFNTGDVVASSSTGGVGYYARKAAREGLVAMAFSGAFPLVAPEGSVDRLFAPNAMAVAVPQADGKIVTFDMTTAAVPFFGVVKAMNEGAKLPVGVAYNADGEVTTNPADVAKNGGALKTFGGPKGSGFSFMLEAVFTGVLAGASVGGDMGNNNWGNFVMVLDPKRFGVDPEEMKARVSAFVARMHEARRASGYSQVFAPGERGDEHVTKVRDSGEFYVSKNLVEALAEKAQNTQVSFTPEKPEEPESDGPFFPVWFKGGTI